MQTNRTCQCTDECQAKVEYLNELGEIFDHTLPGKRCAAMFAESIQGVSGAVQFPKGYVKETAALVRSNGGIFVSDEV